MKRYVAGRLNGVHAVPGTILGPRDITREYLVVIDNDETGCTVGFAQEGDIAAALAEPLPRSVTEHRLRRGWAAS